MRAMGFCEFECAKEGQSTTHSHIATGSISQIAPPIGLTKKTQISSYICRNTLHIGTKLATCKNTSKHVKTCLSKEPFFFPQCGFNFSCGLTCVTVSSLSWISSGMQKDLQKVCLSSWCLPTFAAIFDYLHRNHNVAMNSSDNEITEINRQLAMHWTQQLVKHATCSRHERTLRSKVLRNCVQAQAVHGSLEGRHCASTPTNPSFPSTSFSICFSAWTDGTSFFDAPWQRSPYSPFYKIYKLFGCVVGLEHNQQIANQIARPSKNTWTYSNCAFHSYGKLVACAPSCSFRLCFLCFPLPVRCLQGSGTHRILQCFTTSSSARHKQYQSQLRLASGTTSTSASSLMGKILEIRPSTKHWQIV